MKRCSASLTRKVLIKLYLDIISTYETGQSSKAGGCTLSGALGDRLSCITGRNTKSYSSSERNFHSI